MPHRFITYLLIFLLAFPGNVWGALVVAKEGNVTYDIGRNLVLEAKHIVADVKGNMTLESVQNSSESKNSSKNAGAGVNLGETLTLAGATIANAYTDDDGKLIDGGNLRVEAKHLVGIDLKDFEKSDQKGFSLAVSTGDVKDTNAGLDKGTTTIGLTHAGHEKEGVTRATIGKGEIVIGDGTDVASLDLNRDIDNRQEITKDVVTGALDLTLKVDNRIFSDDGCKEIADQQKDLGKNSIAAVAGAIRGTANIGLQAVPVFDLISP